MSPARAGDVGKCSGGCARHFPGGPSLGPYDVGLTPRSTYLEALAHAAKTAPFGGPAGGCGVAPVQRGAGERRPDLSDDADPAAGESGAGADLGADRAAAAGAGRRGRGDRARDHPAAAQRRADEHDPARVRGDAAEAVGARGRDGPVERVGELRRLPELREGDRAGVAVRAVGGRERAADAGQRRADRVAGQPAADQRWAQRAVEPAAERRAAERERARAVEPDARAVRRHHRGREHVGGEPVAAERRPVDAEPRAGRAEARSSTRTRWRRGSTWRRACRAWVACCRAAGRRARTAPARC